MPLTAKQAREQSEQMAALEQRSREILRQMERLTTEHASILREMETLRSPGRSSRKPPASS